MAHLRRITGLSLVPPLLLAVAVYAAVGPADPPPRYGMLGVSGRLGAPLWPGAARPLDLRVVNRYGFALRVTRLTVRVAVDHAHGRAGCRVARDFRVWQLPSSAYPIVVPAASAAWLHQLGVQAVPWVAMRNLRSVNQDACQGATLSLRYRASAVPDSPRRRSIWK